MPGGLLLSHPGCMLCNSGMTHLWHTFCSPVTGPATLPHKGILSCVGGLQMGIISRTNFLFMPSLVILLLLLCNTCSQAE